MEAWDFASKLALRESYDGDFKSLMKKALRELRQKSNAFNLDRDYEEELLRYEYLGDYTKGVIDYLPFALVNVTGMKCIITQVNDKGNECSMYRLSYERRGDISFIARETMTKYDIVTRAIKLILPSLEYDNLFMTYLCLYQEQKPDCIFKLFTLRVHFKVNSK